ncbi:carbonic anhydrase [Microthyrium microscopicum]|uniref:Carbonic anhydrase n=1 Tax=Microthyrium microscopicum TaxID=703497 RepID=A0A6A6UGR8_9PEZI|nr:carbonic anhydrase [Microthyrium microscopicum]
MAKALQASRAGTVVISCSDPRLNPYQVLGIDPNLRATMVRNAGGRVNEDVIKTLTVLQTIASPGTIAVMHHTDCGLTHVHDDDVKKALIKIAPEKEEAISSMKFGEIKNSVREDLELLRASPYINKDTQIVGLKYDINTGELSVVEERKSEL